MVVVVCSFRARTKHACAARVQQHVLYVPPIAPAMPNATRTLCLSTHTHNFERQDTVSLVGTSVVCQTIKQDSKQSHGMADHVTDVTHQRRHITNINRMLGNPFGHSIE
jgi:hypothetical protein